MSSGPQGLREALGPERRGVGDAAHPGALQNGPLDVARLAGRDHKGGQALHGECTSATVTLDSLSR